MKPGDLIKFKYANQPCSDAPKGTEIWSKFDQKFVNIGRNIMIVVCIDASFSEFSFLSGGSIFTFAFGDVIFCGVRILHEYRNYEAHVL